MISKEKRENDFRRKTGCGRQVFIAASFSESFVERGKIIEDFDVDSLKHILQK